MEQVFRYNYNSYTTKPNVIRSVPTIDVNFKREEKWTTEKSSNIENGNIKNNISIEELAEMILADKEKARGFKYASKERRTIKRSIINDIKKGKIRFK